MKRTLLFLALFPLMLQGQVQNTKLADRLLLEVLSGANALSGAAITSGTPTSGVTYQMGNVGGSSDFSASGAATTANGVVFKADGDAPAAWDGAILRPIDASALTLPDPAYTMTNSGAIPTYGHKGNDSYFAFDGVDDVVTIPTGTNIDNIFASGGSILVRMKTPIDFVSTGSNCFYKGETNISGWQLFTSNGVLSFRKGFSTNYGTWSYSGLSADTWYTIAITYNASATTNDPIVYVDGTAVAITETATPVGTADTDNGYGLNIGKAITNDYAKTILGQFMVFNYISSADSVAFYSNHSNHLKAPDNDGSGHECTFSITTEGMISQSLWRDYYHSIDVPLSGATSPRLVKSWAGMNDWRFNGTTSYLSKTGASDGLTGDITISCWVYPTGWGESNLGRIFDSASLRFFISFGGQVCFTRDGSSHEVKSASSVIILNQWNHIVVTSDLTGISNIYVNGILSGSANQSAGTPLSGTDYYVGSNANNDRAFYGVIEGFKITKDIWSKEQIALSYGIYE